MFKSFKSFFAESSQQGFPKSIRSKSEEMEIAKLSPLFVKFNYQGWTFEPTIHAAAQSYDRRPDLEVNDWKKMHRNVLFGLKSSGGAKVADGEYLFFSKSADQAYVAAVNSRQKQIRIVTVLPKGRSFPKPGTDKMIVEVAGEVFQFEKIVEVD